MNPYLTSLILMSLGMGTMTTFASSHWMTAWMGLEINTIAILPLMIERYHPRAVEATTKYLINQATAATLMLFSASLNAWLMGSWEIHQQFHPTVVVLMTLALGLKVGLAPMHFWLPEVIQGVSLTTGLIMSTWQKLAPMMLLYQISPEMNQTMLISMGLMSIMVGGWGGLNQTQLRKLMAYSSIAHMGWMMTVLAFAPKIMALNMVIYILMTTSGFMTLKVLAAKNINKLATSWAQTPMLTVTTLLVMLSLGGLPPMTGFVPKWAIMAELTKQDLHTTVTIMALTALLSLFFYMRICYTMTLTAHPQTNNTLSWWRLKMKKSTIMLSVTTIMTLALMPITPAILALLS
uniref:NADH dehydrogenase subunit 2 n=1 Tax=Uroconger lepturus TaxID=189925 RepID=UPI0028FCF25D|nr:NADH dehydrogenase subunit 2 [Uroconger lepturus]WNH38056.1 NADH dehydrogenase subunit 2 [Uroconger lepturus]